MLQGSGVKARGQRDGKVERFSFAMWFWLMPLGVAGLLSSSACNSEFDGDLGTVKKKVTLKNERPVGPYKVLESGDLELDWHEGVAGALVFARSLEPGGIGDFVFVSEVKDPQGNVLYSVDSGDDLSNPFLVGPPIRPMTFGAATHMVLPQSDMKNQARGKYTFRIAAEGNPRSRQHRSEVTVVRRLVDEGTLYLDLNLFFVKGSGLSSNDLENLEPALKMAFDVFEEVGIQRGEVAAFDINAPEAEWVDMEAIGSNDDAIRKLVQRSSAAKNSRALNLFFVPEIGGSFGTVLGLSMGLPGALTVKGSNSSGVVISVAGHETADGLMLELLGLTMAHEAGHFMGLFHTSEAMEGMGHDIIEDTPECVVETGGAFEIRDPANCPDSDNLMFWAGDTGGSFSPGQGQVLRSSVVLRGGEARR